MRKRFIKCVNKMDITSHKKGGLLMYCKNCGGFIDSASTYCKNCGANLNSIQNTNATDDNSSFGFAILGFFIPILGLIFFLVYEGKKPKRAKSAGKGALIGFITKIVITIILVVLYVVFAFSLFDTIINETVSDMPAIDSLFEEETSNEILGKYADVTFGEFKISNNGYYSETALNVTVKNKSDTRYTYYITIEAVDSSGARLDTDTIYVDRLNAGQEIYLTAFEYVEQEKIEQFKNATFRVLEIDKYDY